jgi:hypothetical protein
MCCDDEPESELVAFAGAPRDGPVAEPSDVERQLAESVRRAVPRAERVRVHLQAVDPLSDSAEPRPPLVWILLPHEPISAGAVAERARRASAELTRSRVCIQAAEAGTPSCLAPSSDHNE